MSFARHTPSLSEVLPFTKGTAPAPPIAVRPTYQKKRGYKLNRTVQIAGVDWYPRFVRNDELVSLSDVIPYEELKKMFLVCVNAPRPADWKKQDQPIRFFAAFKSALDFVHYIKKIPPERWSFFEYIMGSQNQKLYFDVDIKMEEFLKIAPGGDIDSFARGLISELVHGIVETFAERGVQIDLTRNLLLFSSHSTTKRSFHIIVNGYAVVNNEENFILASEVLDGFPEIYRNFIDTGMYSSKQQLRLYGSQKTGSGRPKVFVEKWFYGTTLIESNFYQDLKRAAHDPASLEILKFTTLFLASCVTVTTGCQLLPAVIEPEVKVRAGGRPKLWAETHAFDNDFVTEEIKDAIHVRADPRLFEIYRLGEIKGSLITLIRHSGVSNDCSLCNRRHDNDNAFLTVNSKGHVYFHCHAFRRHQKRDAQGTVIGPTSKYITDVSDLLPPSEGSVELEKLADAHRNSILQQIMAQIPKIPPSIEQRSQVQPPSVMTKHQEMRLIGSQPNSVIKARKGQY